MCIRLRILSFTCAFALFAATHARALPREAAGIDFVIPVPAGFSIAPADPGNDGVLIRNDAGDSIEVIRGPALTGKLDVERCRSISDPPLPEQRVEMSSKGEGSCHITAKTPGGTILRESIINRGAIAIAIYCVGKSPTFEAACTQAMRGLRVVQAKTVDALGRSWKVPSGWSVQPKMLPQQWIGADADADAHAMPVVTLLAPKLSASGKRPRITIAPPSPLLERTKACAPLPCSPEVSCSHDATDVEAKKACSFVSSQLAATR